MSQQKNISLALMQLEQSLNNLQNGLIDTEGKLVPDERWFSIYDDLLTQIITARAMADTNSQGTLTDVPWEKVVKTLDS